MEAYKNHIQNKLNEKLEDKIDDEILSEDDTPSNKYISYNKGNTSHVKIKTTTYDNTKALINELHKQNSHIKIPLNYDIIERTSKLFEIYSKFRKTRNDNKKKIISYILYYVFIEYDLYVTLYELGEIFSKKGISANKITNDFRDIQKNNSEFDLDLDKQITKPIINTLFMNILKYVKILELENIKEDIEKIYNNLDHVKLNHTEYNKLLAITYKVLITKNNNISIDDIIRYNNNIVKKNTINNIINEIFPPLLIKQEK